MSDSTLFLVQETTGILGKDVFIDRVNSEYYIEGVFLTCDVPNGNNRIYPKALVQAAIDDYYESYISSGKSIGELDHPVPQRVMPTLNDAALIVEELSMDVNGVVTGRARVLKRLVKGIQLANIIDEQITFGTSFRALTELKKGRDGVMIADKQLKFNAWDAVLFPSNGKDLQNVREDRNVENVWCVDDMLRVTGEAKPTLIQESQEYDFDVKTGVLTPVKHSVDVSAFKLALI